MRNLTGALVLVLLGLIACQGHGQVTGWLHWRGPNQNGTSTEAHLPEQVDAAAALWSIDLAGRGTPVIARYGDGDRVFAWGYRGRSEDLVEVLVCLDAATGATIWEHAFSDFLSDIIYNRYSIGSPTVDAESGNVYLMTSPGLLVGFDRDGRQLWQRSMMEEFGRLTFPNGRTGAPSVEGDLVIVNTISTNWGREGPARNRFYAFDKFDGDLVWSSTPGVGPPFLKDSSFCSPVFEWRDGLRLFYVGTGCGNIVAVNALTGDPIWRYQLAMGGVNSSIVIHGGKLIAIHGKENLDDTGRGRMVALALGARPGPDERGPKQLDRQVELWRNNELSMFTSSPVIVHDRVYQVTAKGDLVCVDALSGHALWHKKLGADQLHASPLYGAGKLYVPMWHDGLYVLEPTGDGARIISHSQLAGACLGSPAAFAGRLYLHTTEKLYCFGSPEARAPGQVHPHARLAAGGQARRLLIRPAEVRLRPGQKVGFEVRFVDEQGHPTGAASPSPNEVNWRPFIPPTARVKVHLNGQFDSTAALVASPDARWSAGAFAATVQSADRAVEGTIRGRILPSPPYQENFESFQLAGKRPDGIAFAYPPLSWIGARLKWEVRDLDGSQVLAKTLDRWLFQRSMVFLGHADDHDYTVSANLMSDGNRRMMSDVGLVNQRYIIVLRGNGQRLEVNSNIDRLAASVAFAWKPGTWYRLKTRVDVAADGQGTVRGKVWPRSEAEPADWTIKVPVERVHRSGSPGLFGFAPNIKFAVYIDNIQVTPNR